MRATFLCALFMLHVAVAVNFIYDETLWTKQEWEKYKIDFNSLNDFNPSEEAVSAPELKAALSHTILNSLDGTSPRRRISKLPGYRGQCPSPHIKPLIIHVQCH